MTLKYTTKYLLGFALALSMFTHINAQVVSWTWNTSATDTGASIQNGTLAADYAVLSHAQEDGNGVKSRLWIGSGFEGSGDFIYKSRYTVENFYEPNTKGDVKSIFGGPNGRFELVHNTFGEARMYHSGGTGNNYNVFWLKGDTQLPKVDGQMYEWTFAYDIETDTINVSYTIDGGAAVVAFSGASQDSTYESSVVNDAKGQNGFSDSVSLGVPGDILSQWAKVEVGQWGATNADDASDDPLVHLYSVSIEPADLSYGGVPYVAPADPWLINNPDDAAVIAFSEDFSAEYEDESGEINDGISYTLSGNYTQDTDAASVTLTDLHNNDTDADRLAANPAGTAQPKWYQPIQVTEVITTVEETATGDNPDTEGNVQVGGSDYAVTQEDIDAATGTVTVGDVSYVLPGTASAGDPLAATEADDHTYISVPEVRTEYIGDWKYSITYKINAHRDANTGTDIKVKLFGNDGFLEIVHNPNSVRVWHNNFGAGASGNIKNNTNVSEFVDGIEITWNIYYQVDYDVIGIEYSIDGGAAVPFFGGEGNGATFGDIISNHAELELFKYSNNPIDSLADVELVSASLEAALSTDDNDGDGLTNIDELTLGTNPDLEDSDGDSLADGAEVNIIGSDPTVPDTALLDYLESAGIGGADPVAVPGGSVTLSQNGDNFELVLSVEESSDLATFSTMTMEASDVTVENNSVKITIDGSSDKGFFRISGN